MNEETQAPEVASDVHPIPVAEFEGEFVRAMEGKLPAITLDMPEGYPRGTHLKMEVEMRVRNVSYLEDRRGDLTRQHTFALEEVKLVAAFDPATRPNNVGGNSAGDAWVDRLVDFLDEEVDELDFDGEEVPDRLREMLKLYFDRVSNDGPASSDEGVGF